MLELMTELGLQNRIFVAKCVWAVLGHVWAMIHSQGETLALIPKMMYSLKTSTSLNQQRIQPKREAIIKAQTDTSFNFEKEPKLAPHLDTETTPS